jgi:predicted amidohydrolase
VKVAIAQITSSDQPAENLATVLHLMDQSAGQDILFLPEVTNCISVDRAHQFQVLEPYAGNSFIEAVCARARHLGLWVALGSVTVKTDDDDGRFANRSVMINAEGEIVAFYDKIHMFDVTLSDTERYHESKGYPPRHQGGCRANALG